MPGFNDADNWCDANDSAKEQIRMRDENKELKRKLNEAYQYLREGKLKFSPMTTNSLVDDWLKWYEESGEGRND